MKDPVVSVVITTKNSSETLNALLKSLKDQTYSNLEIIIVDNKSQDKTKDISQKYTTKIYDFGPERSSQRNYGAKQSKGDYLLILDSDMVLGRNVVAECVFLITREKEIKEIIIPEKSFGEGIWSRAKALEREINEGEDFFESSRFFDKDIFWKFGGFDETMTGPEDWDLPQRISKKYKVGRIKEYILHNEGNQTLENLVKKKYYYGLSAHKYLKKQNLNLFGPVTIYFLRPAFYKNWRKLFKDPFIYAAMVFMLFAELIGGGIGYIAGRIKNG